MAADCRARCVDGADLGSPAPGTDHMIAHADPRCPVHGDTAHVEQYIAALEKVAERARPVVARDSGPFRWADDCTRLAAALAELKELD